MVVRDDSFAPESLAALDAALEEVWQELDEDSSEDVLQLEDPEGLATQRTLTGGQARRLSPRQPRYAQLDKTLPVAPAPASLPEEGVVSDRKRTLTGGAGRPAAAKTLARVPVPAAVAEPPAVVAEPPAVVAEPPAPVTAPVVAEAPAVVAEAPAVVAEPPPVVVEVVEPPAAEDQASVNSPVLRSVGAAPRKKAGRRKTAAPLSTQNLSTQDLSTQDLSTQDLSTQDLSTQDPSTQDLWRADPITGPQASRPPNAQPSMFGAAHLILVVAALGIGFVAGRSTAPDAFAGSETAHPTPRGELSSDASPTHPRPEASSSGARSPLPDEVPSLDVVAPTATQQASVPVSQSSATTSPRAGRGLWPSPTGDGEPAPAAVAPEPSQAPPQPPNVADKDFVPEDI